MNGTGIKAYPPQSTPALAPLPNLQLPAPVSDEHIKLILAEVEAGLRGATGNPNVLDVRNVNVAAGVTNLLVLLPAVYDHLTFFFPTATPAGFRIGPEAASIPLAAFRGYLTLPGTTKQFMVDNPGAAYSFVIFGVIGFDPVTVRGW